MCIGTEPDTDKRRGRMEGDEEKKETTINRKQGKDRFEAGHCEGRGREM